MHREVGPRDLGFTAGAFVLGLLPRLYVAIAWAREPVWDGHYYDFGAKRLAAGLGYSDDLVSAGRTVWHPWCHYPVGYSGFLGLVYRVFGSGPHVAPIANALTGALLVALVHRLARYATTPARARLAGVLAALSPGLILYAALLMTEPLAALGIVATAWLFVRSAARDAGERARVGGLVAAGVVLGLTALVRPQSLLCAPALLFLSGRRGPGSWWRTALPRAALASGVALAVVAPWSVRNCRVMDGCALVSTNAGWNLAIGAFPRATGRFETLHATDGCPVVSGQVQQDRCWRDEGLRWIRAEPGRWLALMPKKLSYTFDHESFPMGYLGEADPASWPEEAKGLGREVLSGSYRALLVLALLGVIGRPLRGHGGWRDRLRAAARPWALVELALLMLALGLAARAYASDLHPYWPLAVLLPLAALVPRPDAPENGKVVAYLAWAVGSVVVTHAIFFGEDRYHMAVTPVLCILAACALRPAPRVRSS